MQLKDKSNFIVVGYTYKLLFTLSSLKKKIKWYLEWNIYIVNVNYNPFTKYNLHDGDLAIILLVVVPRDVVQCNVKCNLDFDDLKSISQQKNLLNT
jgi:hypothetical protein